jgi:hypothetical protein
VSGTVPDVVRVEREIAAPVQEVYDAWTDPTSMQIWMAPEPLSVVLAECDVRLGDAVTTVAVTLTPMRSKTLMVIEHSGLPVAAREPHSHGWTSITCRLDRFIAE